MDFSSQQSRFGPIVVRGNPKPSVAPQGPHYAKGVGGLLERLLPAVGSTVGAVGGTLLAPGVGTAAGGAGGALAGQKLQDLLTGQHTSGKGYAGQAALGTLGGVGKAAGAIKGGVNAIKGGEDVKTAANVLRLGPKGAATVSSEETPGVLNQSLVASQANAGKGFSGKVANVADKAGKQAMISQTGSMSRPTAESALRDIGDLRSLGYSSFAKAAEHAPVITGSNGVGTIARQKLLNAPNLGGIDTSNFIGDAKDILASHTDLPESTAKNIVNLLQKTADKHGFEGDTSLYGKIGVSHPAQLDGAIRDLQTAAYNAQAGTPTRKALVDIVNTLKNPLDKALGPNAIGDNVKNEMISALKTQGVDNPKLVQAIKKSGSYRDIAQLESKFVTASKVADEGQVNSLRGGLPGLSSAGKPTITGMANQAAGRVVEKGVSSAGNAINKLAGKTPGIPNSLPQLAGKTAKSVGKVQGVIRGPGAILGSLTPPEGQPQQPQATDTGASSATDGSVSTDSTPAATPFTQENVQRAIAADIAATGGAHVTELIGLYNAFGSPAAQKAQQTSLSATDQVRHDSINSAQSSLDAAEANLLSAGGAKGPIEGQVTKVPVVGQYINNPGTAYESTKIETATNLAKAITGGSRPAANVIEQYLHSLPSVTDTKEQAQAKLNFLRSQLAEQAKNFGFNDLTQ